MTYRIEITADSLDELKDQLWVLCVDFKMLTPSRAGTTPPTPERDVSGLKTDAAAPTDAVAEPVAKRRGRPPKDQFAKEIAEVVDGAAAEAQGVALTTALHPEGPAVAEDADLNEEALETVEIEVETPELIYKEVRKRVLEISKLGGRERAMDFLESLGVDNAQKLHPDQWADAIDKADVLLAKLRKEKA